MTEQEELIVAEVTLRGEDAFNHCITNLPPYVKRQGFTLTRPVDQDDVEHDGAGSYLLACIDLGFTASAAVIFEVGETHSILGAKPAPIFIACKLNYGDGDDSVGLPDHAYLERAESFPSAHDAVVRAFGLAVQGVFDERYEAQP